MVHIDGVPFVGVDVAEGEVGGVDAHLAFEGRGGCERLGPIAHQQLLPSFIYERIDDEKVVIQLRLGHYRRSEINPKRIDEVAVEVELQVRVPGELAQQVVVGIDTRDPVGLDGFAVDGVARTVLAPGNRFRDEERQIRHSAHRRGVDIVEGEREPAAKEPAPQHHLGVGHRHLHLAVQPADIMLATVGVVAPPQGVYLPQETPHPDVVGIDLGNTSAARKRGHDEIHGRKLPWLDRSDLGLVTLQLSR